jgi:GNAT superfamily N-acetyltransferase
MKPEIRLITKSDLTTVKALAKHIWDGQDYLHRVAAKWIEDGFFFGLFEGKKLIACVKLSYLPGEILWLEGLRVHQDWQGQGLGKLMHQAAMHIATGMLDSGQVQGIEFATYFKNEQSIHIATQTGFKQVHELFLLSHPPVEPIVPKRYSQKYFGITSAFPTYVPCGWKFIRSEHLSSGYLQQHGKLYSKRGNAFYAGGDEPVIILLSPAGEWIYEVLPVMQHLVGEGHELNIIVDSVYHNEVSKLKNLGFDNWEKGQQDMVLVFRYFSGKAKKAAK